MYERFAIPHAFKPQLSFPEAIIAAMGAFLRIFLGSLLFAVWGAYTMVMWSTIRTPLLRVALLLPMILLFLVLFTLLMMAIAAAVRSLLLRRP